MDWWGGVFAQLIADYSEDVEFDDSLGTLTISGSKHLPYNKQIWFPEGEQGTPNMELVSPQGHNLNEDNMLNTGGGSITDGKAIIDRILASTCEIHIHAVGRICSMGIYILAAAEVRTSSALTSFMFHESSYDVEGKHSENKSYIKFSDIDEKHLNRWLATRTKKPADFWNKLGVGSDYWFLAEEAKTLGMIVRIV